MAWVMVKIPQSVWPAMLYVEPSVTIWLWISPEEAF